MKALPRFLSVALPLGAFSSLALATQSDEKLVPAYSPASGRTTAAATAAPSSGSTQPLIATCLPAIKDQSGAGCIQASSVPTFGDLLPLSNYFNVTPAAEVGIGTASPEGTLHMLSQVGYAEVIQDGPDGTRNRYRQGGAPTWDIFAGLNDYAISRSGIDFPFIIEHGSGNTLMNAGAGNVGIGTSTPTEKLDVAGNIKLRTLDRFYFGEPTENGDPIYLFRQNGAFEESTIGVQLGNDAGGIDRFEIYGAGILMRVWGNGLCQNTTGAWTVLSDRRMKKNIEPLQGSLAKLLELQGVHYEYSEKAEAGSPSGVRTGFIAQDVEQVFPEWVSTREDGTKALTIQGFEALAVEGLRELQTEIDGLRESNAALEARVARLESVEQEVASLKAALATLVENR